MGYLNEFESVDYKELCKVHCPSPLCGHTMYISTDHIHESFKCHKCGSEWSSKRKTDTQESSTNG